MQSIRRFFPRQYLVPTALLVVTSFGALFSLLYYLTNVQDRLDTERDRQTIGSAMQSLVEFAVHDLQDYAVWDDAFRALVLSFDPVWADDNIGVYLGQRQGYTHLFIIENGTSTIYSYDDGSPTAQPLDAFATVGEALRAGVEAAGTAEYSGITAVGAFTSQGGNMFVYAAADLTPLSPGLAGPEGLRRTMVITRPIDGALVDSLSSRYRTGALRLLTDSGTVAGEEMVTLRSVTDEPIGAVVWTPDLLRRPDEAERILGEFRARGIRISLDDFGTGFSSIGYLQRLSLDRIKMDRSFVAAAELGGKPYRLAAAIVELGRALDLPVTVEGVESENQAELMRRIGCASLQGWLFGHALSAQEVEARLGMDRPGAVAAGAKASL